MVNCVTSHVTFTILSLHTINVLASGESQGNLFLGNIIEDLANNMKEYG